MQARRKTLLEDCARYVVRGVMIWTVLSTVLLAAGHDYVEYLFFESLPFLISLAGGWIVSLGWIITR